MGRREQPIRPCSKSLRTLAAWLRAGREQAGLTYQQLAACTPFSPDTLSRAASGKHVPRNVEIVVAYAGGCGLPEADARRLWKLARRDASRAAHVLNGQRSGLHISMVKDFADLHSAIVEQYQNVGSPALRKLDERIGGHGRLPHSTVGRVLNGQSLPQRPFVLAFAEAVNVRKSEIAEWAKAWDRADRDLHSTRSSRRASSVQGDVQGRLTKHDRVTPRDLQLLMSDLEGFARRTPGIKLLVIPEAEYPQTYGSASRMTRELLVGQAQRQGDLSCPRCHKPSFGYDDAQGWRAELCTGCALLPVPSPAALSGAESSEVLVSSSGRPQLPRRVPGRSWPPSSLSVSPGSESTKVFEAAGPLPQVCCRLCLSFHKAQDGCPPVAEDARGAGPGCEFTAAVAGGDQEAQAVDGTGELGACLAADEGVLSSIGPPGTAIPSVTVAMGSGCEGGGVLPGASARRRPSTASATHSGRSSRGATARSPGRVADRHGGARGRGG